MVKNTKIALIYDFDGTLSTTDMQDYELIPEFGMSPKEFWNRANIWGDTIGADQITASMFFIKKTAEETGNPITKQKLNSVGNSIQYYEGVVDWFERINEYGKSLNLDIEHYIISAGLEEIIDGTIIRKYFKEIYACCFVYNEQGHAIWPSRVVNYSGKIQSLSKINKGLGKLDDRGVNEYVPDEKRPIPVKRMIYFGDGNTDIPSMRFVKEGGGNAIAVYQPHSKRKQTALKLLRDNRVNFALPADYRECKEIDIVVKTILDKLATERDLDALKAKEEKKKLLCKE
jgi:2-hydroxy-3-keto-5-methylthiopentenyl-1-phosphate phosphatase